MDLKVTAGPKSTSSLVDMNYWSHYQPLLLVAAQSVRRDGQLTLQLYPSQRQTVPGGRERPGRCVLGIPLTGRAKMKLALLTG